MGTTSPRPMVASTQTPPMRATGIRARVGALAMARDLVRALARVTGFGSKNAKAIPVTAVSDNDDEGFAYGKEEDDDDWWRYDWRKDYMANKSPIKEEAQDLFTHYDSDDLPLD